MLRLTLVALVCDTSEFLVNSSLNEEKVPKGTRFVLKERVGVGSFGAVFKIGFLGPSKAEEVLATPGIVAKIAFTETDLSGNIEEIAKQKLGKEIECHLDAMRRDHYPPQPGPRLILPIFAIATGKLTYTVHHRQTARFGIAVRTPLETLVLPACVDPLSIFASLVLTTDFELGILSCLR